MGCASSKQSRKRCRSCQTPYSPMPRSYSMHVIHPPQQKGDNYHLVALTSTTLGSLHLDDDDPPSTNSGITGDFSMDLIEAKTWSSMIEDKIPKIRNPKTPNMTPPGEPETINTWELMEGLDEDFSPCRSSNHVRSFSFDVTRDPNCGQFLDGNMISVVRKSMEELSPSHPFHLKPMQQGKQRVVVYFTSLRGVRKTYEDSCDVRVILKGLGVRVDERDVSMHSGFKEELRLLLGGGVGGFSLPRVFISGKYVGGADEIRRMHEEGSLEKAVQGCEKADDDGGGEGGMCEGCGDVRFVPCETCSGSCKIYYEEEEDEDDDEDDDTDVEEGNEVDYGFQRCPDCNENGLIRCPICCFL